MPWPPLQDVAHRLLHLPCMDVCVHVFCVRGNVIPGPTLRRLAWPTSEIDHINRDKTDNRIANLRQVTRSENCQNKNNVNLPGITWHKPTSKWQARIKINQKLTLSGDFASRAQVTRKIVI
jgi:hypothetical protein